MKVRERHPTKIWIGWREWVALPDLGVLGVKAKVDTGARTSCLHAFDIELHGTGHNRKVHFGVHPLQRRKDVVVYSSAPVHEERTVTDSGGHKENRVVIITPLQLGHEVWPIEVTLTNREDMSFRMLLGRQALVHHTIIDPTTSYNHGRELGRAYRTRKGRTRRQR